MMPNRWAVFLDHHLNENDPLMEDMRREAEESRTPLIRRETEYFLRWLVALKRPERILEIGTGTGYSAICMLRAAPYDASVLTIEQLDRRVKEALLNFERAGFLGRISLEKGDAATILPELKGQYDLVFLDAAKGQYPIMLPDILNLLSKDGVLVCDNIMQEGSLLESRFAVRRRDRTIHTRMREFIYTLTHDDGLVTDLLQVGDGIAVSVKK